MRKRIVAGLLLAVHAIYFFVYPGHLVPYLH